MSFSLKVFYYSLVILLFFTACKENEIAIIETDFCSNIHRNDSVSLSQELEPYNDLMQTKTGVYVLEDGSGSMVARAWLSEYAEKTIDIQYFIFSTDDVRLIACDYLVRAEDRGVKVRIIVDDIMVDADSEDILTFSSHENIELKIYKPGTNLGVNIFQKIGKLATNFRSVNQRIHNKTFIVDSKAVIIGGRNIADEYFDYDHEYNFRDRDILLFGKESKKVSKSFDNYWNSYLSKEVSEVIKSKSKNTTTEDPFKNLPNTFKSFANSDNFFWLDDL